MKKIITKIFFLTLLLSFIDRITKYIIALSSDQTFSIVGDFFKFQYAENTGIAFGIPIPKNLLILINIILIFVILYLAKQEFNIKKTMTQVCVSLILAGGIGNFYDRIYHGYVIDFISIWKYPTFNIADIYITVGVLLIIVFYGKIKKA